MSEEGAVRVSWRAAYSGGRHSGLISSTHDRMQCMHRRCNSAVLGDLCMLENAESVVAQHIKHLEDITYVAGVDYVIDQSCRTTSSTPFRGCESMHKVHASSCIGLHGAEQSIR
jgi:hypothetical protein